MLKLYFPWLFHTCHDYTFHWLFYPGQNSHWVSWVWLALKWSLLLRYPILTPYSLVSFVWKVFISKVKGKKNIIDEYTWANLVEFKLEGEFSSFWAWEFNKISIYLDCLRNSTIVQGTTFKHFKTGGMKWIRGFKPLL